MAALHQLIQMEAPGDVLSPSSANQYINCGAKWRYRKIERLADPPTGALTLGSAVHAAIGANMEQKVETKEDLPPTGVMAIYREAWDLLVRGEYPGHDGRPASLPTEFRNDEEPADLRAQGEALALKYLDEACPEIQPVAVELPVAGAINGVRVRGFIDLLDTTGRVIDLKTPKRTPSDVSADYRFQVATYRFLTPLASGEARLDSLVKLKTPKLVQQSLAVDASDLARVERMYPGVQQAIRAGIFMPNRQSYMCSRSYCAFWRYCEKDWGGKVE